jgi:GNAT superfamily N-acetyltransferase
MAAKPHRNGAGAVATAARSAHPARDSAVQDAAAFRAVTVAQQPDLEGLLVDADRAAYPAFLLHSALADVWPSIYEEFPEYQFALLDAHSDAVLAHGNSVPFRWDGRAASLPDSATALAETARATRRSGKTATALGALQAVVHVEHQGRGLSRQVLQSMAALADQRDLADLFAPIRPTHKERYPLFDMEAYIQWHRSDGSPQDPWMRVHHQLGAKPVGVPQAWAKVTGSRAQWEQWTGMSLPQTGTYVVPGGLVPVHIDVEADHGHYEEPHVWMHYRIHA